MPSASIFSSDTGSHVDPRNVLSSIGEVVYTWDIASDAVKWGPNAEEVLGAIPEACLTCGLAFAGLVEPGSGPSRYDAIFGVTERDKGDGVAYRTRYVANLAGRRVWVEDTGRWFAGSDGKPTQTRGVLRLERTIRPGEIEHPNGDSCDRPALMARIATILADNLPAERPVTILVAAIDELARLNDDFGHEATDEIIGVVQERLRSVTRRRDHLVRYSGNRFAILLAGCPQDQIEPAARRFIRAVARSAIETARGIALVRLRVGAAIAPALTSQAGQLLSAAEGALATARHGTTDSAVIARTRPRAAPVRDKEQAGFDVKAIAALNQRKVRLALQPIVRATSREVAFHEALLRVEDGQSGSFFANSELIPMLERRGLVRLFDHRVLELAADLLARNPGVSLSINMSPRSLADPEWLEAFLSFTGSARNIAGRLVVEITETATIEDPARVAKRLAQIKERGARIAIDDFGAGHTSLRHLRAFPIDVLKIDGAFTQNLRRSTDDRFYVRTLLGLAHHLGVETVAEWVDDEVQAAMLAEWGVTYLQGHLVGEAQLPRSDAPDHCVNG
ncbi:MAG: GGDEF-domain containing protein [Chelatococcus sp.]|nr:MAG: GGDEF-domain containing protein [Chelatococcus sp.]